MQENFGSKPEDLLAAVGPSVCMDCYEVSEDVIEQFKEAFEKSTGRIFSIRKRTENIS